MLFYSQYDKNIPQGNEHIPDDAIRFWITYLIRIILLKKDSFRQLYLFKKINLSFWKFCKWFTLIMLELFHFLLLTHSATGSFFSSFSSLFFAAALARGEVVWTPWDVTSGPRFCSGTAEEGESEGVPDLLPVGAMLTAVEVSSLMADSMGTLGPVESTVRFSAAWSFGFSTRSRGVLVTMGSKTESVFELDCNYKWCRASINENTVMKHA